MKQAINIIVSMILLMAMAISILPAGAFAESEVPEVTDVTLSEPAETETEAAEQAALAESTPEEALPDQDAADAGAEETSAETAAAEEAAESEPEGTDTEPVDQLTSETDPAEENSKYIEEVLEESASQEKDTEADLWTVDENGNPVLADEYKIAKTTLVRVKSNGTDKMFRVYRNGELYGEYFYLAGTVYGSVAGGKTEYIAGDEYGLVIGTARRGDVFSVESDEAYLEFKVLRDRHPYDEDPGEITVGQEFDLTFDLTYPVKLRAPMLKAAGGAQGSTAEDIFASEASFKAWLDSIVPEFIDVSWTVTEIAGYDENIGGVWRFQVNISRIDMEYNGRHVVFTSTGPGTSDSAMCGQMGQGVPPGPVGDSGTGQIYRERYDADNVAAFKAAYERGAEEITIGYWYRFYRPYQDLVCIQAITYKVQLPRNGVLELKKASANPGVTDGNLCYSLEGTEAEIVDKDGNVVATALFDAAGKTDPIELPAGEYTVRETKTGRGYKVDPESRTVTISAGETGSVTLFNQPANDPNGIVINKTDPDTKEKNPQGKGTLADAEFTVNYYENYDLSGSPTRTWVYRTNANGYISMRNDSQLVSGNPFRSPNGTIIFPLGSYEVRETKAPLGYKLNDTRLTATVKENASGNAEWKWNGDFDGQLSQEPDGTYDFREASVIRGGARFRKTDAETGEPVKGAEITIFSNSDNPVMVNGTLYGKGKPVAVLTTDENGYCETAADLLPYGSYFAKETKASEGYLLNSSWRVDFNIENDGLIADCSTGADLLKEQIMRGDLSMLKLDIDGNPKSSIPFMIVKLNEDGTEGEWHVIVSDTEGMIDTSSSSRKHTVKTNSMDEFVDGGVFTDSAKLNCEAGVWFGQSEPDDSKGALPYGKYRIYELQTDELRDKKINLLESGIITVDGNGKTVKVTPMVNLNVDMDSVASSGGRDFIPAKKDVAVQDTVSYTNLTAGRRYTLMTEFVLRSDPGTVLGSAEKDFYPPEGPNGGKTSKGSVTIETVIDTSPYAGDSVVAFDYIFEYINGTKVRIASHTDIDDKDQTLRIPGISTTAKDMLTGDNVGTLSEGTGIIDTVRYVNLERGEIFKLKETIVDPETGEVLRDSGGNELVAERLFMCGKETDSLDMPVIRFSSEEYGGKSVVVTEELYWIDEDNGSEEVLFCSHAEYDDSDQTVTFPSVKTSAKDPVTGTHTAAQQHTVTIEDTVSMEGLITGKEYTLTGTPVYKEDFTDAEGVEHKAGEAVALAEPKEAYTFVAESSSMTVILEFKVLSKTLKGTSCVVFETLMHNGTEVAVHADLTDRDQTVTFPSVRTRARDMASGMQFLSEQSSVILDTVEYSGLTAGDTYMIKGRLMDRETGEETGTAVTGEPFTAAEERGVKVMEFMMEDDLRGRNIVIFEDLYLIKEDGTEVLAASHEDFYDEEQTLYSPEIGTRARGGASGTHEMQAGHESVIKDTVEYRNLKPGVRYTIRGVLMNKSENAPILIDGEPVRSELDFVPDTSSGTVELEFVFDSSLLAGKSIVVFESLEYEGTEIAVHADIEDLEQTVNVINIGTHARDERTGTQTLSEGRTVKLTDTVAYTGLTPGKTYILEGTVMVRSTGKALVQNGIGVSGITVFTPKTPDGRVEVSFVADTLSLPGEELVVFERLYDGSSPADETFNSKPIAVHEDLSDKDQTLKVPARPPVSVPHTGDTGRPFIAVSLLAASGVALAAASVAKRRSLRAKNIKN